MKLFREALLYVLENEGERFTDDPDDSGGATKFGITQRAYAYHLDRLVLKSEIENLTLDDAFEFYEIEYWNPVCRDLVDIGIATALFDTSVLYGQVQAVCLAQSALNGCGGFPVKVDGKIGFVTVKLLNKVNRSEFLHRLRAYILLRIARVVHDYPKNQKFEKGWCNRAGRILTLIDDYWLVGR